MIFRIVRVIIIIFSLACFLLLVFALVGSYKAENWLTQTYLIDFHFNQVNLKQLFSVLDKRDRVPQLLEASVHYTGGIHVPVQANSGFVQDNTNYTPTPAEDVATIDVKGAEVVNKDLANGVELAVSQLQTNTQIQLAALAVALAAQLVIANPGNNPGFYTTVSAVLNDIANNFDNRALGLADVYLVSFFGYCRGYINKDENSTKVFDNSNVNFTWCLPAKTGFKFDPLEIVKSEVTNMINGDVQGALPGVIPELLTQAKSELKVLVQNLSYDTLNLPNNLTNYLNQLHSLTIACMALIFVVAVLGFLSIVIQCLAICILPDDCCATFLNFMGQLFLFLVSIIASGLVTGVYLYVRKKINDATEDYGIRLFISINLYAFVWSATMAALLVVIFLALGSCCGLFGTHRRMYTRVLPIGAAAFAANKL